MKFEFVFSWKIKQEVEPLNSRKLPIAAPFPSLLVIKRELFTKWETAFILFVEFLMVLIDLSRWMWKWVCGRFFLLKNYSFIAGRTAGSGGAASQRGMGTVSPGCGSVRYVLEFRWKWGLVPGLIESLGLPKLLAPAQLFPFIKKP